MIVLYVFNVKNAAFSPKEETELENTRKKEAYC